MTHNRLVQRLLGEAGRADIPVAEGIATESRTPFTQARWAQRQVTTAAQADRAVPSSVVPMAWPSTSPTDVLSTAVPVVPVPFAGAV